MSHTDSTSPINTIIIKIILHTYLCCICCQLISSSSVTTRDSLSELGTLLSLFRQLSLTQCVEQPHCASRNTQQLLKAPVKSSLLSPKLLHNSNKSRTFAATELVCIPSELQASHFFIINYESESKNNSAADSHTQIGQGDSYPQMLLIADY